MFSRSLNQIICLWRNILKIIIIEISLKWIKFRGYLSVFSCIFSTVWPKFLPLDSGTQPAASAVQSAYTSSVIHLCWEWTAVSTSTLYSTSAHRQAKKLKFVYQIVYAVILSGMFFLLNGPKASNHLLHRTSVWEHWWRMKKPVKL